MTDVWKAKQDQHLDSELSAEEMRAIDAHLRECPSCSGDALRRMQLERAIRLAGQLYAPSAEFPHKILRQVRRRLMSAVPGSGRLRSSLQPCSSRRRTPHFGLHLS